MIKPNNYDNVQTFRGFETLELGGHICIIKKVEECKSSTGKDMIRIFIDTDKSDKQPNFYENRYKGDTRENKKWGCIIYQLVLDSNGDTSKGFKSFVESVIASNKGFEVQWNENFENCFKGKLVAGVFGKEEYYNALGESKFAIKCVGFRTLQDLKDGKIEVPKDKLLNPSNNSNGFNDLIPVNNDDLPF